MNKFDFKRIIEWLSHLLRCPVCGYRFSMEQTKIIDSKDDKNASANLLIHTDCDRCKSSVVFSIAVDGPEVFTVGVVTDLTSSDTTKFKNSEPLTSDDVLAAHQFLSNFDGDFKSVLDK